MMADLSKEEINEILKTLGNALVAEATGSLPTMPRHWENEEAWPTASQMSRLKFIKNLLTRFGRVMDDESARRWFTQPNAKLATTPADALKHGRFDDVRDAAASMVPALT